MYWNVLASPLSKTVAEFSQAQMGSTYCSNLFIGRIRFLPVGWTPALESENVLGSMVSPFVLKLGKQMPGEWQDEDSRQVFFLTGSSFSLLCHTDNRSYRSV